MMNLGVYPLRPWKSFYTLNNYLSAKYHAELGNWHRGEDINLVTGGDSDFGYPVQSMFPGMVTYAAQPEGSGWGGIVVVRTEDWLKEKIAAKLNTPLSVLDIQYAHLHQITVATGYAINAGDHIGSIGKGGYQQYVAHLHLEARRVELSAAEPQGGDDEALARVKEYTIDPKLLLANLPLDDFSNIIPGGKHELDSRMSYFNDGPGTRGTLAINRVGDKAYVKTQKF